MFPEGIGNLGNPVLLVARKRHALAGGTDDPIGVQSQRITRRIRDIRGAALQVQSVFIAFRRGELELTVIGEIELKIKNVDWPGNSAIDQEVRVPDRRECGAGRGCPRGNLGKAELRICYWYYLLTGRRIGCLEFVNPAVRECDGHDVLLRRQQAIGREEAAPILLFIPSFSDGSTGFLYAHIPSSERPAYAKVSDALIA